MDGRESRKFALNRNQSWGEKSLSNLIAISGIPVFSERRDLNIGLNAGSVGTELFMLVPGLQFQYFVSIWHLVDLIVLFVLSRSISLAHG